MKHVAMQATQSDLSTGISLRSCARRLTRLEDECACDLHISAIARRLDPPVVAHKWTHDERGSLADLVERAKLYTHAWPVAPGAVVVVVAVVVETETEETREGLRTVQGAIR